MEKFIPYEKLSKKEKRKLDAAGRGSWNGLNPVTRKSPNPKAYNRQKARKWTDDVTCVPFCSVGTITRSALRLTAPFARGSKKFLY